MSLRISVLAAASVLSFAVAGCSSTRMAETTQPAPLPAAPAGQVTSGQLPPPAQPDSFPTAPGAQDVALATPAAPPANAPDVTAGSVTGVWRASVGGQDCQIATSMTKRGANNRAAPLRCAAPADGIAAWNVSGKQLTFFNGNGETVATLYSSGGSGFSGQTQSGQPISLSR